MRGLPSKACPNHQALLIRACHHHLRSHSGQKSHLHAARDSTSEEGGGTFCLHHLHPQRHENQTIKRSNGKSGKFPLALGESSVSMAKNHGEKPGVGKLASPRWGIRPPKPFRSYLEYFVSCGIKTSLPKSYGTGRMHPLLPDPWCPLGV